MCPRDASLLRRDDERLSRGPHTAQAHGPLPSSPRPKLARHTQGPLPEPSASPEALPPRYKVLYREGARAESTYILLEGELEHTSLVSELSEALRRQRGRGDGSDGVHGLPVGQETLTNVSRMTTATAALGCRLLQFSAADLGLSRDAVMREYVRTQIMAVPLPPRSRPTTLGPRHAI